VVHHAVEASGPLFRRRRAEEELDEELQFHLERRPRKASPKGFLPRKRATERCARWAAWRNRRGDGTRGTSTG
jgi:hypothetical protein